MILHPSVTLAQRYMGIIAGAEHDPHKHHQRLSHSNLLWMCDRIEENANRWPEDKTGRWLGFIQGVIASQQLIDVDEEREVSRPLFHSYYERTGVTIPDTIENG